MRSRAGRKSKGKRKCRVRRADFAAGAEVDGRDVSGFVGLLENRDVCCGVDVVVPGLAWSSAVVVLVALLTDANCWRADVMRCLDVIVGSILRLSSFMESRKVWDLDL